MKLVVDANIVFSALIADNLTDVIFSPKLDLVAPDLLFEEIRRHRAEIKAKSRLSETESELLLMLLEKKVQLVPMEAFAGQFSRAEQLLRPHVKDVPYVALALTLKCPVWTYEKRFAGKVDVVTPAQVRKAVLTA